MGQALYRSNRPRSLDEVVGQEHIVRTLKNAIKSKRISHAYLFTGPRGTGKTSIARILAHEINDIPYSDDSIDLDIIEIDAASNRRIDEIRDLREKVHIAPAAAKYKVYIIDEVHMLTKEAFNALLKTLEEPPVHCVFILATTEVHKLPETIISRTQRYTFKPINVQQAADHLAQIAKSEKISISREALELLAQHGGGSFRDSISLLDQLSSSGLEISADTVRETLGMPKDNVVDDLLKAVEDGDNRRLLQGLDKLYAQNIDPAILAAELSTKLRSSMIELSPSNTQINLLKHLLEVSTSPQPKSSLEIALLEACIGMPTSSRTKPEIRQASAAVTTKAEVITEATSGPTKSLVNKQKPVAAGSFSMDDWPAIVERVKTEAASLYTALRLASPNLKNDTLTLSFQFPLHQKKIAEARAVDIISKLIKETWGSSLIIKSIVDKTITAKPALAPKPVAKPIQVPDETQTISNIFGGAELLES